MLLPDTSVWIDFFRRAQTPAVQRLVAQIKANQPVAMCPPVLQEILQGATNREQFDRFARYLRALPMLAAADPADSAASAALLYLRCREAGQTIRSSNDCMIAALAIEHRVTLLHSDRDFFAIAQVEPAFTQTTG